MTLIYMGGNVFGPYGGLVALASQLFLAAATLTRLGEQVMLPLMVRVTQVDPGEVFDQELATELRPLFDGDLTSVDWYLEKDQYGVNAYATGRHSIVLTAGFLAMYARKGMRTDHVAAIVAHELGHLRGEFHRLAPLLAALTQPLRWARHLLSTVRASMWGSGIVGRCLVVAVPLFAGSLLLTPLRGHPEWVLVLVLAGTLVLLERRLRWRDEFRADSYASQRGYLVPLVEYLEWIKGQHTPTPRWRRALDTHPLPQHRIEALVD